MTHWCIQIGPRYSAGLHTRFLRYFHGSRITPSNLVCEQIVREDNRLRAACTNASQSAFGGGTEERLQIDLSDLRAEEAATRSDVEVAGLKIQRCDLFCDLPHGGGLHSPSLERRCSAETLPISDSPVFQ